MAKKNGNSPDRARQLLAQETARIIVNQGIRDYRRAKIKAAENLGMENFGALPRNAEIELAVTEHLQIFGRESHDDFMTILRAAGLSAMELLSEFDPRLVGPTLSGTASESSPVNLHVFSDSPELVAMHLTDLNVGYRLYERRLKSRRDQTDTFAGFAFVHDDVMIEATVFPVNGIRQAPISPVDGKPMKRADIKAVRGLIPQA